LQIEEYSPGGFSNANIRVVAAEKWVVTEPERVQRLLAILNTGGKHAYEDGRTRALIECGNERFFLNKDGDVQSNESTIRINISRFLRFHDSLKPSERVPLD
jgi:hypothetical protein